MAVVVVTKDEKKPIEVKLFNFKSFYEVQVKIDLWRERN